MGTEMVYDMTQTIEAYLIQHNKKPKSFYDQMLDRQREQELVEMAREQEQLEKKHKEQVELESKIQSEMKKKEEVLRRLGVRSQLCLPNVFKTNVSMSNSAMTAQMTCIKSSR